MCKWLNNKERRFNYENTENRRSNREGNRKFGFKRDNPRRDVLKRRDNKDTYGKADK